MIISCTGIYAAPTMFTYALFIPEKKLFIIDRSHVSEFARRGHLPRNLVPMFEQRFQKQTNTEVAL